MTNDENIVLTEADQQDLAKLFSEADPSQLPTFHPILRVWKEVTAPAIQEAIKKPTPMWCSRITMAYQGLSYADMYEFRDRFFSKLLRLREILLEEIATDDDCLTYTTVEDDRENNTGHYKALLLNWQLEILKWEMDWDCLDPYAEVEIAAIAEVQKTTFGPNGITGYLDHIGFVYTEDDQAEMSAALAEYQTSREEK